MQIFKQEKKRALFFLLVLPVFYLMFKAMDCGKEKSRKCHSEVCV